MRKPVMGVNHIEKDVDFKYIEKQLQQSFSKIRIIDGSIDLDQVKQQMITYYREKYRNNKRIHDNNTCLY